MGPGSPVQAGRSAMDTVNKRVKGFTRLNVPRDPV